MRIPLNKIKVPKQLAGRGATNSLSNYACFSDLRSKVEFTCDFKVIPKKSAGKFDDTSEDS